MSDSTSRAAHATRTNDELWQEAQRLFPGGVNSPVRAFGAVGGEPRFLVRGEGPYVFDADGKRYIDFVGSWGPLILGHAHPAVVAAAIEAVKQGSTFGAPTPGEVELGRLIVDAIPSVERVRLVSSGTEAVMSALRLARAFTEREVIVKFEGCYHGHADAMLVAAGSGAATFGVPTSPGVPKEMAGLTLVLPFNDLEAFDRLMTERGSDVAAVIVEPIAGNMGVVPPRFGFLELLRRRTGDVGALLICDEVMTGFRVGYSGAQGLYDLNPDLTTLSKVLGGGFPIGAYGGRADVMAMIAPQGPVYQAGTLAGNPVAVAAGSAQLRELGKPGVYKKLDEMGAKLTDGLLSLFRELEIPVHISRVGSMGTVFFHDHEVTSYTDAASSDLDRFSRWFRGMLERGIYLPPSQFEAFFLSTALTDELIEETIAAGREVAKELAG
jgi:glutamate-1-semialdehyde 2,1-aminomutase